MPRGIRCPARRGRCAATHALRRRGGLRRPPASDEPSRATKGAPGIGSALTPSGGRPHEILASAARLPWLPRRRAEHGTCADAGRASGPASAALGALAPTSGGARAHRRAWPVGQDGRQRLDSGYPRTARRTRSTACRMPTSTRRSMGGPGMPLRGGRGRTCMARGFIARGHSASARGPMARRAGGGVAVRGEEGTFTEAPGTLAAVTFRRAGGVGLAPTVDGDDMAHRRRASRRPTDPKCHERVALQESGGELPTRRHARSARRGWAPGRSTRGDLG